MDLAPYAWLPGKLLLQQKIDSELSNAVLSWGVANFWFRNLYTKSLKKLNMPDL